MKIATVIVTHNRLELLREAVQAVKLQTWVADNIIVVNNGSTDGTAEWLQQQEGLLCINQENAGGAAGFSAGIKMAYGIDADWIWIMDDDTIPDIHALQNLINTIENIGIKKEAGFLCSRVEWVDATPHLMNIPHISTFNKNGLSFNQYDNKGILLVNACSFVSVLINANAVKECGLPYKEFFIWGDDMEYTQRIIKAGYNGLYVPQSVVLHKTATNYSANIFEDDEKNCWKYKYGIRNTLFIIKKEKGHFKFFMVVLKHFFVMPLRILKKRKNYKKKFIMTIWSATWNAIFFNPAIGKIA